MDKKLVRSAIALGAASALLGKHDPPRSVLMLGLAGGTAFRILRHLLPDCRLTMHRNPPRHRPLAATGNWRWPINSAKTEDLPKRRRR